MRTKYISYDAEAISVKYNPQLCIHAAECVKGLPKVFNPKNKPWVEAANASADELISVINKCPSGALKYEAKDSSKNEKFDSQSEINLVGNGPLYFKGDIIIYDSDVKEVAHESRVALCRCGASKNKPFCDNSHLEVGFNG